MSQAKSDQTDNLVMAAMSFLDISNFVYLETSGSYLTLHKHLLKINMVQTILTLEPKDTKVELSKKSVVLDLRSNLRNDTDLNAIVPFLGKMGICCKSLVMLKNAQQMHNFSFDLKINQEVYFLFLEEKPPVIAESYSIGNERVLRNLANFEGGEFRWKVSVEKNFLKRRSDFRQANLVAFACSQSPYLNLKDSEGEIMKYRTIEGGHYEVVHPERLSGVFYDMQVVFM